MSQRSLSTLVLSFTIALTAGPAGADGFDGQRYVPAAGAAGGFEVERTLVPLHLDWGLGLFLHYAVNPVVIVNTGSDEVVARPLERALTLDLIGSIGLFDVAELALHLPLDVIYDGDGAVIDGQAVAPDEGIGDLRLVPKVRFIQTRSFGFGLAVPLRFPTGDDEELRGAGDVTIEPKALLSWGAGRLALGGNAGYRFHTSREGREGPGGDELTFGASLRYRLPFANDRFDLQAEIFGGVDFSDEGIDYRTIPIEALLGVVAELTPRWHLYLGAGPGVSDGVGTPDVRFVFGVRYTRVGFSDSDADGIYDDRDRCPNRAEDRDEFEDEDGCPDNDNDGDRIVDDDDECPDAAEDPGGGDGDGCPERGRAEYRRGRIVVFGKVRFKTNSAELLPSSDPILDDVARDMNRHPEIRRVRVEGHSDNVGDRDYNRRLSRERAATVRQALIQRGVKPSRLEAAGYGELRPIATNRTDRGRAKNRRVQFVVVR